MKINIHIVFGIVNFMFITFQLFQGMLVRENRHIHSIKIEIVVERYNYRVQVGKSNRKGISIDTAFGHSVSL